MPVQLEVSLNDDAVRRLLDVIQAKSRNMKPAFRIIGETIKASVERSFEIGGRPDKWARLRQVTIKERLEKRKWPGQILVRSGALKRSINYRAESDHAVVGSTSKYAAVHQFGAKKGSFGTFTVHVAGKFRKVGKAGRSGATLYEDSGYSRKKGKRFKKSGSAGRSGGTLYEYSESPGRVRVRAHYRRVKMPWGDIPARPFLVIQDEDYEDIHDALTAYFFGK